MSTEPGRVAERRRLTRRQFSHFVDTLAPGTRVVMEACGTAHYWARRCAARGSEVRLLPAQHVKPYVRRNKTDQADDGRCRRRPAADRIGPPSRSPTNSRVLSGPSGSASRTFHRGPRPPKESSPTDCAVTDASWRNRSDRRRAKPTNTLALEAQDAIGSRCADAHDGPASRTPPRGRIYERIRFWSAWRERGCTAGRSPYTRCLRGPTSEANRGQVLQFKTCPRALLPGRQMR